jgi:hypothetical protein
MFQYTVLFGIALLPALLLESNSNRVLEASRERLIFFFGGVFLLLGFWLVYPAFLILGTLYLTIIYFVNRETIQSHMHVIRTSLKPVRKRVLKKTRSTIHVFLFQSKKFLLRARIWFKHMF